jgi:hypothetical protein
MIANPKNVKLPSNHSGFLNLLDILSAMHSTLRHLNAISKNLAMSVNLS